MSENEFIVSVDSISKIDLLAKALSLAQGEFPPIPCSCVNPFYKSRYADLHTILSCVSPVLSKHGLSISQIIIPNQEFAMVKTILMHSSGQTLSSEIMLRPTKADAQGMGSAYTYARRYALAAILSVSADADDDGNDASNGKSEMNKKTETKTSTYTPPPALSPYKDKFIQQLEEEKKKEEAIAKKYDKPIEKPIVSGTAEKPIPKEPEQKKEPPLEQDAHVILDRKIEGGIKAGYGKHMMVVLNKFILELGNKPKEQFSMGEAIQCLAVINKTKNWVKDADYKE